MPVMCRRRSRSRGEGSKLNYGSHSKRIQNIGRACFCTLQHLHLVLFIENQSFLVRFHPENELILVAKCCYLADSLSTCIEVLVNSRLEKIGSLGNMVKLGFLHSMMRQSLQAFDTAC